jgi:hypothetical protein
MPKLSPKGGIEGNYLICNNFKSAILPEILNRLV